MFRHVLFRGITDMANILKSHPALPVATARELISQANDKTEPIWNDQGKPFVTRLAECAAILRPVVRRNVPKEPGNFISLPQEVVQSLDEVFRKHYKTDEGFLLIGRADEDAYRIQDLYARDVGSALGLIRSSYESRAITQLGKVYGSTSIPLLCDSSVSALWEVCRSSFYKNQLFLVSSMCLCA